MFIEKRRSKNEGRVQGISFCRFLVGELSRDGSLFKTRESSRRESGVDVLSSRDTSGYGIPIEHHPYERMEVSRVYGGMDASEHRILYHGGYLQASRYTGSGVGVVVALYRQYRNRYCDRYRRHRTKEACTMPIPRKEHYRWTVRVKSHSGPMTVLFPHEAVLRGTFFVDIPSSLDFPCFP